MSRARVLLATMALVIAGLLAPSTPPAHAAIRLPVGIATVSTMYPGTDLGRDTALVAATGARAIRLPAKWNLIQPGSPLAYNWSVLDAAIAAARSAGLSILLNLEGPAPVWAQKPGADPLANGNGPADPADFQQFAQQVALRYSSRVTAWEVWNEPNLSRYLLPPTAAAYVPLLRAAYLGIRSTGSRQPVISGGTSSSREDTRDTSFIAGMYALGGGAYLDGVGIHPYTFPYPIGADPRYGDGGGAAVVYAARNTMTANGDSGKSVWITEFGYPTGTTSGSVTPQAQADRIIDAINRANALPWIAAFFIFNSQDLTSNTGIEDGNFGMFGYDGTPKPVVARLHSLLG